jgi:NADP-dependent 3-hydroxy acid dehydrogenase YdfG
MIGSTGLEPAARNGSALEGRICIVTGASGGIGGAIVEALASAGASVHAVTRRTEERPPAASRGRTGRVELHKTDLVVDEQARELADAVRAAEGGVDVLVHSAGTIGVGDLETAQVDDLDRQYATNVRAPFVLTQSLLPALRASQGQIVFINSTAGLEARAGIAQYAATKHALKALADGLREEVNPAGIRVVSVYPGRTATPMQSMVHAVEGRAYRPERLLQPEDVATVVLNAVTLPRSAEVTDVMVRPMLKH